MREVTGGCMWLQCLQTRGLILFTHTSHLVQGESREQEECSSGPQADWKPKHSNTLPSSPTHLLTMERLPIKTQEWKGFLSWFLAPCPLGRRELISSRENSLMYLAIARHVDPTYSWSQAHLSHFTLWFDQIWTPCEKTQVQKQINISTDIQAYACTHTHTYAYTRGLDLFASAISLSSALYTVFPL